MESAVELTGVTRRFGLLCALDGVALRVPRGGIYGILGPNGAGKTTTIRILLGLLPPDAGHVRTLGFDPRVHAQQVRGKIGVLLEHDGLYEPMSVGENLEYHARLHGLPLSARRRRAREVLDAFGLRDKMREPAGKLSKGMKRKLAIARAMLHEPELIVLDEPTTGLDARAVAELREGLHAVVQEHRATLLLATHNLAEAERMCDRVAVLDHGRIVLEGPPHLLGLQQDAGQAVLVAPKFTVKAQRAVRAVPGVKTARLAEGEKGRLVVALEAGAAASSAVRAAIDAGARVEAVERPRASLEDAFLAATGRVAAGAPREGIES